MPQLDISTFFTQTFWLIVVFLITYIIIRGYFLPQLSYIIKYRSLLQLDNNLELQNLSKDKLIRIDNIDYALANMEEIRSQVRVFQLEINELLMNSNKEIIMSELERKYEILRSIYEQIFSNSK